LLRGAHCIVRATCACALRGPLHARAVSHELSRTHARRRRALTHSVSTARACSPLTTTLSLTDSSPTLWHHDQLLPTQNADAGRPRRRELSSPDQPRASQVSRRPPCERRLRTRESGGLQQQARNNSSQEQLGHASGCERPAGSLRSPRHTSPSGRPLARSLPSDRSPQPHVRAESPTTA